VGAGAVAVTVGPLIGGFATTYFSWPSLLGVSPTLWLILAGLLTIWVFFEWEAHVLGLLAMFGGLVVQDDPRHRRTVSRPQYSHERPVRSSLVSREVWSATR